MSINIMTESYPVDLSVTEQPIKLTISNLIYQAGANNVTSVNGKKSDVVLTASDVGAATSEQGAKADSALQPSDVAPVALSGSFSDLVNKSSLFSLVYSAYAIGSNVAVNASDTLGQMLGKLQAQINSNVTAINTKEPTIGTGTTSQYWRGDKAWRDFATDVCATVLTGLSTATATAISATDSVLGALGKLQGQATYLNLLTVPYLPKIGAKWYSTGLYYGASYPRPESVASMNFSAGRLQYHPIVILEDCTFDQICAWCLTATAGVTAYIGLYDSNANNLPQNRLVQSDLLDLSTTGIKATTINQTLQSGKVYWMAFLCLGGTATLAGQSTVYHHAIAGSGGAASNNYSAYFINGQSALPAVAPIANLSLAQINIPSIKLRAT